MKVFSLEKFIDDCIEDGRHGACAKEVIERHPWAVKCNHLTSREMNAIGCLTHEDWMIELPDPSRQSPSSESATSLPTSSYNDPLYGDCPVGAVVKIQGIPCRIKSRKGCRGCILTGASMDLCYKYACSPSDRFDEKEVSFVRIKRL